MVQGVLLGFLLRTRHVDVLFVCEVKTLGGVDVTLF